MKHKNTIVIAGAGIVGLVAGALLGQSKIAQDTQIHIIDSSNPPKYESGEEISLRVSAISVGSIKVLKQIGVWESIISERAYRYSDIKVWDADDQVDGMSTINFGSDDFGLPELGFIVENSLIQSKLTELIGSLDIFLHYGKQVKSLKNDDERNKVVIEFSGQEELAADLLIGSDGANSITRKLQNIPIKEHHYSQEAFVAHVECEKHHFNTAWQRFLPEGPIAILPLGKNKASIVWTITPETAKFNATLKQDDLELILTEATDFALGKLKIISETAVFPLKYQLTEQYVDKHFALIGDAAHCIHPLAGQGVNLGIADAITLVETLEGSTENGYYVGDKSTLRPYERRRKGANWMMLGFVDSLNKLFSSRYEPVKELRVLGMRIFNKSGLIKRHAVKIALGVNR
ncbi:MAG: UbiH/UbiF/VisC/COQ6 family ubiquinone biosynthesis hydroxylase [Pseudomonadota bacterium]|nr:UbiH/UbiF/VisC/COQ6 family ubiquinone biosynthesis hydroxylase [Pseudomonadota bacterium]